MWYNYKHGFKSGVRVEIVSHYKYKNLDLIGKTGTVMCGYGSEVRVDVDGVQNHMAGSGHFYFKPHELKKITTNEILDDVKENENMPNITNYFNAVKIKFLDDTKPCHYIYANFEADLKEGDLCVVKPAHHDLTLARVMEVINDNSFETPREVVAKVYTDFYDERVKARAKTAELKAKMQERAKQLQDIALYQMLAKDDPAMQELLNEYQNLPQF